tara:strand:+ start:146 stop:436 length:291 start_codon:yes stop_codon:yes gene_type:complete
VTGHTKLNEVVMCRAIKVPRKGDLLIIQTKKSGKLKIACEVKSVVNGNEVVLQKSTNSFFNWDMYLNGESWVTNVLNIGKVQLTTSLNNSSQFAEY